jgi:hypothetical protein
MHQEHRDLRAGDRLPDAFVRFEQPDRVLAVEIKKWAQHTNLGAVIYQIKQLPEQGLLVANYINPNMADKLRQQDVQFIDATGNACINQSPVYIYVTGKRRKPCLVQYRKLLDRWVQAWLEKLKPKQFVGEYVADTPDWWEAIDIRRYDGYWGGEIAAAQYTNYLTPEIATAYVPEHARSRFLQDARLRKAPKWIDDEHIAQYCGED